MIRRHALTCLLGGLLAVGAAGLAKAADNVRQHLAASSVIEEIKKRGTIRVGLSTFVPWAMPDKKGQLVGFEVDVARKLAEEMGVKLETVPTSWDGIIPALIAGKFDVIISGMSITPQRNLTVNFTIPYENTETLVVINKKLGASIKTVEDLNKPDVILANRRGATTAVLAEKLFPNAQQLLFDEEGQTLQELINGKATAALASAPTPALWAAKYPDVLVAPDLPALQKTSEAFAVRKGDPDAINFFDNWILVHRDDGWLKERYDYWFKGRAWADQVPEQQ
ncbi:MAG: transporter substrate-binding domain-containing protein [Dongiaceae bacterium]